MTEPLIGTSTKVVDVEAETNKVKKTYKFVCPTEGCGCEQVEQILTQAVVSTTIKEVIGSLGDDADIEYGPESVDDGSVDRFQCLACGFILRHNNDPEGFAIDTPEDLWDWLMYYGEEVL
jgi:hypothetical protein